ncbi:asparagine--tRNA ligase [bacterium (Candidatus Blackallbacteria) CG17_big_fil_post_rev_8_21_14_2_50_48_46]|uniref:Asparagine--tRNA ligase n=1 Tax=bacterium (Candidatus Blackallbacteria) CG17_big_fil_post_rev_8_21_14_2_50_48_46 TaxID=2014261 RepID=A0A2M7G206_9BACT|nr:MAG: asparagine--tRNA ligase [bacterium (Candidatus Blackallbacteria) CG18_big_fil_WC_8_21_14_2_50_49_26]PIW15796.1 MAG: asparagine--tRNA ligase [bacterium (Candidatus Blackallbacteria) CG17_big_fil_post_rev_8_21_14_2_50_48_46]PIW47781.1 MAG: asparagine--tRNA ligase [bacterium (Candidatus Blackallbacteria) CG13_big_fil_rev_8_21_14_2_50_49_14]
MTVTTIDQIHKYPDQTVTLRGWLYNKRESGKLVFLILRDGTGFIQCVAFKKELDEAVWEAAKTATQESSLIITGSVRQDDRAPYCGYEMGIQGIEIVSKVEGEYPISLKEHGPDFLLEHRHLWLRTPSQMAVMRIRAEVLSASRDFFDERGFTSVDAPIITANACEGTTNLFEIDYFEDKAYLSQTGQLYMEAAALALGKVYCLGPAFRAEKSKTRKHLTEFWMIEPEVAYLTFEENLAMQEEYVAYVVQRVLQKRGQELKILERDLSKLESITAPFPKISYDDAVKLLQEKGSEIQWGDDLGAPDETILGDHFEKPVFVHRFPSAIKAFYMKPDPERPEVALGADLIAPDGYGEIIGGGQRIDDYDLLVQRIQEHDLPMDAFSWYLDLRKYGSVPHGGFGLGIERLTAWISGVEHVRETSPFPRTIYRIQP